MDFMDTALQAAWEAGDILLERFNRPHAVAVKGLRDVATEADFAAQRAIVQLIQRSHPDHLILAEEGVGRLDVPSETPTWVIDPLDGTTNYTRGFPAFSVSIGLVQQGTPVLGVIHEPLSGRTFIGGQGAGAHLLSQSGESSMTDLRASQMQTMEQALVGFDWAHDNPTRKEVVDMLAKVAPVCRTLRASGSAALGLAYTAAGWLDGYFHFALQPWDAAAGVAIVQAAGGKVTRPDGSEWRLDAPRLFAGSPQIVEGLSEMIAQ